MNVVSDTSIVGLINQAINNAEANNAPILRIELNEAEMKEFVNDWRWKQSGPDKLFTQGNLPAPTDPSGVKNPGDAPLSVWYRGVILIRKG